MVPVGIANSHVRRFHIADRGGHGCQHWGYGLLHGVTQYEYGEPDCLVVLVASNYPFSHTARSCLVYHLPDGDDNFAGCQSWTEAKASGNPPLRVADNDFLCSYPICRHSYTGHPPGSVSHGDIPVGAIYHSHCKWSVVFPKHLLRAHLSGGPSSGNLCKACTLLLGREGQFCLFGVQG